MEKSNVEYQATFTSFEIDFRLLIRYCEDLSLYLENRLLITESFSYHLICFITDVHPIISDELKPSMIRSRKKGELFLSMNTTTFAFMAAEEQGKGLEFLKGIIDGGLLFHEKKLLNEGVLIK